MKTCAELSAMCRDATTPDRTLDGEIFRRLESRQGDVWADDIGDDGVWYREDPLDPGAWDAPPHYSESMDAVHASRPDGMTLTSLREYTRADIGDADPDWRQCGATVTYGFRRIEGSGATLALAYMDAVIRAVGSTNEAKAVDAASTGSIAPVA